MEDYIKGCMYITEHYSKKLDMRIYTFGDVHKTYVRCNKPAIRTDDFIMKAIKAQKDIPIDLYLETPYLKEGYDIVSGKEYSTNVSYITGLNHKLGGCIDLEKKDCKYKNLRAHYVDIRKTPWCYKIISSLLNPEYDLNKRIKYIKEFKNKLENSNKSVFDIFLYECDINKINKQKKYVDEQILKKIDEFFHLKFKGKDRNKKIYPSKNKMIGKMSNIIKILNEYKRNKNFSYVEFRKKISEEMNNIIYYSVPVMDYYALLRMFRSFEETSGKYSGRAKNIIIYVGNMHAYHYRSFFEFLGFKRVKKTGKEMTEEEPVSNTCLSIKKFPIPLF